LKYLDLACLRGIIARQVPVNMRNEENYEIDNCNHAAIIYGVPRRYVFCRPTASYMRG